MLVVLYQTANVCGSSPGGFFCAVFSRISIPAWGFRRRNVSFSTLQNLPAGFCFPAFSGKTAKEAILNLCVFTFSPTKTSPGAFSPPIHRAILIASENGVKSQKRGGKTTKGALFLDFRHFYATFSAYSCRYHRFPSTNCVRFPERRRALLPLRGSISDFSPFAQKDNINFI